jgi:hypothetical protein
MNTKPNQSPEARAAELLQAMSDFNADLDKAVADIMARIDARVALQKAMLKQSTAI